MIKKINIVLAVFAFVLISACGGSDDPSGGGLPITPVTNSAPSVVSQLIFPTSDQLCIDNTIEFNWSVSTDADGDGVTYRVKIGLDRDLTNIVEQFIATSNSTTVTLTPGTAYYWNVTATDNQDDAAPSATFAFYTEGTGVANYAPFTAALNAPALETSINAGNTTLDWTGGDADIDDTLTYDLYFSDTATPALLQTDVATSTFDVTTVAATTYFWRVDTKDNNGVKTIGQVWTFSTN